MRIADLLLRPAVSALSVRILAAVALVSVAFDRPELWALIVFVMVVGILVAGRMLTWQRIRQGARRSRSAVSRDLRSPKTTDLRRERHLPGV